MRSENGHMAGGLPRRRHRQPLDPYYTAELDRLRREGAFVLGPAPASRTLTMPTRDVVDLDPEAPGMRCLLGRNGRLVVGFGGTADEAVRDALIKLQGIGDPGRRTYAT